MRQACEAHDSPARSARRAKYRHEKAASKLPAKSREPIIPYPALLARVQKAHLRAQMRKLGIRGGLTTAGWLKYIANKRKSPEEIEEMLNAEIAEETAPQVRELPEASQAEGALSA